MRWIVCLLLLAVMGPFSVHAQVVTSAAAADGDEPDPVGLLEEVNQRYADAKYYHIEATEEREMKQELSRNWSKTVTTAVMAPGNRYHFEVRAAGRWWVQISDGKVEWILRPGVQEYMQQAPPQAGPSEFNNPSSSKD